jgi:hypothetical protein
MKYATRLAEKKAGVQMTSLRPDAIDKSKARIAAGIFNLGSIVDVDTNNT